jgi:N-acetylmuramoyl-L-alanine amidase
MAYPFVQARYDYGPRKVPVRAFLVHMAEGGGTVGYLSRDPARGVSVHYVIETTGRIVQMLREDHISGSVNPAELRTTDDSDHFYGVTAAKAVMGASWSDPNTAVISVEIEGYAVAGPNTAETGSLRTLVADVKTRYPAIGLLGHRDFADYKACPGKLIDWPSLGGHGVAGGTDVQAAITDETTKIVTVADGAAWYELDGKTVLTHGNAALAGRPSPYGVGSKRAIFATWDGQRRMILVVPSTVVSPVPPVVDCDDVVKSELDKAATRAADAVRAR